MRSMDRGLLLSLLLLSMLHPVVSACSPNYLSDRFFLFFYLGSYNLPLRFFFTIAIFITAGSARSALFRWNLIKDILISFENLWLGRFYINVKRTLLYRLFFLAFMSFCNQLYKVFKVCPVIGSTSLMSLMMINMSNCGPRRL